jgi:benzoyl-CoA reductase/2-hydroxyglutaryl-CoA dehydratase subunit BcrC/BadD/HgdB
MFAATPRFACGQSRISFDMLKSSQIPAQGLSFLLPKTTNTKTLKPKTLKPKP